MYVCKRALMNILISYRVIKQWKLLLLEHM